MAVTSHMWLAASMTADSIVVFGSERFVRLAPEHTGVMPGKTSLGAGSAARALISAITTNVAKRIWLRRKQDGRHWEFIAAHLLAETGRVDNYRIAGSTNTKPAEFFLSSNVEKTSKEEISGPFLGQPRWRGKNDYLACGTAMVL
jgi:hypothetical protein